MVLLLGKARDLSCSTLHIKETHFVMPSFFPVAVIVDLVACRLPCTLSQDTENTRSDHKGRDRRVLKCTEDERRVGSPVLAGPDGVADARRPAPPYEVALQDKEGDKRNPVRTEGQRRPCSFHCRYRRPKAEDCRPCAQNRALGPATAASPSSRLDLLKTSSVFVHPPLRR